MAKKPKQEPKKLPLKAREDRLVRAAFAFTQLRREMVAALDDLPPEYRVAHRLLADPKAYVLMAMNGETITRKDKVAVARLQKAAKQHRERPKTKKVFVLYGDNPRDGAAGTYDTRAEAERMGRMYVRAAKADDTGGWAEYTVEEHEVRG
jgi:hypothetical protein